MYLFRIISSTYGMSLLGYGTTQSYLDSATKGTTEKIPIQTLEYIREKLTYSTL